MVLKSEKEEAPAEVRAIEVIVDRGGMLKAEEVVIHVSRNYEWDVSLSGNEVTKQTHVGNDEHVSYALGNPRAMFRNLEIRAWQKISFHKSGYDVVPFIRITAKGRAIFIEPPAEGAKPKVHNADAILIRNSEMQLLRGGEAEHVSDRETPAVGATPRPSGRMR